MNNFSAPRVVIRPALPRDKADVAEFTKFIWDGHDYVGEVFPHWLEDPQGQLLAAEYAGRCVGTAKVTLLAPGQWWLEGFRVDPKFQDMKIGSRLDAACNEWWNVHGDGVVRLLTSSKRVKVHHLSEERGYMRLGEVYAYEAQPLAEPVDSFAPLRMEDMEEAAAFCQQALPGGLMSWGWKFMAPNPAGLRTAVESGLAWWWRGRAGILSAWEDDDERGTYLTVGFAANIDIEPTAMLVDFRRFASARGDVVARWMGVVNEPIARILNGAGYQQKWEDAGYLYERQNK